MYLTTIHIGYNVKFDLYENKLKIKWEILPPILNIQPHHISHRSRGKNGTPDALM